MQELPFLNKHLHVPWRIAVLVDCKLLYNNNSYLVVHHLFPHTYWACFFIAQYSLKLSHSCFIEACKLLRETVISLMFSAQSWYRLKFVSF